MEPLIYKDEFDDIWKISAEEQKVWLNKLPKKWEDYIKENGISSIKASWKDPVYKMIMEDLGFVDPDELRKAEWHQWLNDWKDVPINFTERT